MLQAVSMTKDIAKLQNLVEDHVKVNDIGYAADLKHAESIFPIQDSEEQTMLNETFFDVQV